MLEPKMALEDLYDWADCVTSQHVTLKLHSVKGHSGSEGNGLADKVARRAVIEQLQQFQWDNPNEAYVERQMTKVMTYQDLSRCTGNVQGLGKRLGR
jgi:hypothetical protein